jgi:hypothetical protein
MNIRVKGLPGSLKTSTKYTTTKPEEKQNNARIISNRINVAEYYV